MKTTTYDGSTTSKPRKRLITRGLGYACLILSIILLTILTITTLAAGLAFGLVAIVAWCVNFYFSYQEHKVTPKLRLLIEEFLMVLFMSVGITAMMVGVLPLIFPEISLALFPLLSMIGVCCIAGAVVVAFVDACINLVKMHVRQQFICALFAVGMVTPLIVFVAQFGIAAILTTMGLASGVLPLVFGVLALVALALTFVSSLIAPQIPKSDVTHTSLLCGTDDIKPLAQNKPSTPEIKVMVANIDCAQSKEYGRESDAIPNMFPGLKESLPSSYFRSSNTESYKIEIWSVPKKQESPKALESPDAFYKNAKVILYFLPLSNDTTKNINVTVITDELLKQAEKSAKTDIDELKKAHPSIPIIIVATSNFEEKRKGFVKQLAETCNSKYYCITLDYTHLQRKMVLEKIVEVIEGKQSVKESQIVETSQSHFSQQNSTCELKH